MNTPSSKLKTFLAGLFIAGFTTLAQALPIAFMDTYSLATPIALDGTGDGHGYSHYIALPAPANHALVVHIDGLLTPGEGYDSSTDTLSSAMISLFFTGSSGAPAWTNGRFDLSLGGVDVLADTNFATLIDVDGAMFNVNLITGAGVMDVLVSRTNAPGTAYFWGSTLNVIGERNTDAFTDTQTFAASAQVPAPATLGLLGLGLLGLGFVYRQRQLKSVGNR